MLRRLFLGFPVPDSITSEIEKIQTQLQSALGNGARFVRAVDMHVTLHFLGKTEDTWHEPLTNIMIDAAADLQPTVLALDHIDAMPHRGQARLVYLGLRAQDDRLAYLHAHLGERLAAKGFSIKSGPWLAHITLARLPVPQMLNLPALRIPECAWKPDTLVLYESALQPATPRYRPLVTVNLP